MYRTGATLELSTDAWCTLIRQAWLLDRTIQTGHGRMSSLVFSTYHAIYVVQIVPGCLL